MSAEPAFQTLILGNEEDIMLVSFRDRISSTICSSDDIRMPAEFENSAEYSGHTESNTVPVAFITEEQKCPSGFIQNIPQGGKEFFANYANLRYGSLIIQFPSSEIFIQVQRGGAPSQQQST